MIVDWEQERPALKGNYIRDETAQAEYLKELLDIFTAEQISGAFVFTFVQPSYMHDENTKCDLDMAGYGIVAMQENGKTPGYRNMPWVPKRAFHRIADYYARLSE